jgi:hypothetical protein
MTGTNCDFFTHKSSRSYLNHLVLSKKTVNFYKKYLPNILFNISRISVAFLSIYCIHKSVYESLITTQISNGMQSARSP